MTHGRRILKGFLVLLGLALVAPSPRAQEAEPVEGEVTFGPQYYVDEEKPGAAKFEEYRDVPNGFVAERLFFSWSPKPRFYFDVDAYDLTQRDQRIGVEFGKTDVWRGTIRWTENRRLWTDQAFTLFTNQGGGVFTLEDSFQSAVQAGTTPNTNADADPLTWDPGTKGRVVQLGVAAGAQDVFVGHQRRNGGVGFEFSPTRNWTFSITGNRDRRDGTTPQTLGMYFTLAPAEVAAPYDFRTDWVTGTVEYSSRRFNAGAQVTASTFETAFKSLTWDDQLFLNDTVVTADVSANPGRGRLLLGADNDWTRVSLFGGFNLPGRSRIDASFSRIEATQNDAFLPMTINSAINSMAAPPATLPATSYDGKHETTSGQIRVSSRPRKDFRWSAWVKSFELKNESPSLPFADYVQTDYQFPLCGNVNVCDNPPGDGILDATDRIARRSLPYGYERRNAGFSVGYAPVSWFVGTLSFERENMEREHSAVEDSDEDIYKLALDFDAGARIGIRTTLRHQERRADHYEAHYFEESFPIGEAIESAFNVGMRRFYWTDRDRDSASLLVDWTPHGKVSIYAEGTFQDDDYMDPETGQDIGTSFTVMEDRNFDGMGETYDILLAGRTKDETTSYTLGLALAPAAHFNLYADFTWEKWEHGLETRFRCPGPTSASCPNALFAGVGSDGPNDNWGSDTVDEYTTASVGFDLGLSKDAKWRLRLDASRSEGTGNIETHFVPGGAPSGNTSLTEFPELKTTLTLAVAALTHSLRPNLDYSLRYWYESWEESNFASDFNEPYMGAPDQDTSMAQALFLGLDFKDYTNHILSFLVRYRY